MDLWSLATHNMHPIETITKLHAPTQIYLMNLRDGTVIDGFESEDENLVFSTHHMNACEEGDEVMFDLACNQWDSMATFLDIENMLYHPDTDNEKANFILKRVRLNLHTKAVVVEDWPNERGIPILIRQTSPSSTMTSPGTRTGLPTAGSALTIGSKLFLRRI